MSRITTMAELKKWYSDSDIAERNVLGVQLSEDTVWILREQCRTHKFYTPIHLEGDSPLRFLHVSRDDPSMVAYTANDEKGLADIQTKTTFDKYCHKFGLDAPVSVPKDPLSEAIALLTRAADSLRDRCDDPLSEEIYKWLEQTKEKSDEPSE